jgi:hypothetical protein
VKPRKPLPRRQGYMKRTPLKRTPINPVSKKQREKNREGKAILQEFAETHESCSVCGYFQGVARHGSYGRSMVIHHLGKGW